MQKSRFVELTDGTRMEVKMNFGTMYYLDDAGGTKLAQKIQKMNDKGKEIPVSDNMRFAAKLIYAMLRSNGKKVTFDEALELTPPDPSQLLEIAQAYQEEVDAIKKKQQAKANMRNFHSK